MKSGKKKRVQYNYIGDSISQPLRNVLKEHGVARVRDIIAETSKIRYKTLIWTRKFTSSSELCLYTSGVYINRIPSTILFARKDRFHEITIENAPRVGRCAPITFEVPKEFDSILKYEGVDAKWLDQPERLQEALKYQLIYKPSNRSCGRGIEVLTKLRHLKGAPNEGIIQEYIERPLLLQKHKFDLRVYVLITSLNPLICYIHDIGLCRMASSVYDGKCSRRKVLTNYSVNKDFIEDECTDMSYKRPMDVCISQLEEEYEHVNKEMLMRNIDDALIKMMVCYEREMCGIYCDSKAHCFLLLGADVILDEALNAWVLEANTAPSFSCASELELKMKETVMGDTLRLVGFLPGRKPKMEYMGRWQKQLMYEDANRGGYRRLCPSPLSYKYLGKFSNKDINQEVKTFCERELD